MENTILNFNSHTIYDTDGNSYEFQDFTDLYYEIDKKYYTDSTYFKYYTVGDNERLENISYELYNTTDRWDIILIINKMNSPLQLPQDNNVVISRAELNYQQWEELYGQGKPDWYKEIKLKYFTSLLTKENEVFRNLKVIRPTYMSEFMYDLDDMIKEYQSEVSD